VKAQGVGKGQTNRARGDDRGLGVKVPGAEVGQRGGRYQRGRGPYAYGSSGDPGVCARVEDVERSKKSRR